MVHSGGEWRGKELKWSFLIKLPAQCCFNTNMFIIVTEDDGIDEPSGGVNGNV